MKTWLSYQTLTLPEGKEDEKKEEPKEWEEVEGETSPNPRNEETPKTKEDLAKEEEE